MDALQRIWRRLLLLVGRGRIRVVDDTQAVQRVQVQLGADEIKDGAPRLSEYGFQSNPPPGADAVVVFLAGERTNGVVVATGHQQYRMKLLKSGEVAISDNKGQHVYLSENGIRIDGGALPIQITNAPTLLVDIPAVTMTGSLHVEGLITGDTDIVAGGEVKDQGGAKSMSGMRSIYNAHHHGASPTPDNSM
jgi:phage baseplate assembly protein V